MADIQLRFRHISGDIGPWQFPDSATIQQVKERLFADWPKEGPLAKETPSNYNDIKLINSGKWVDNSKALREYRKDMGEPSPDTIVTMHVIVRAAAPGGKSGSAPKEDTPKGCSCCIQ